MVFRPEFIRKLGASDSNCRRVVPEGLPQERPKECFYPMSTDTLLKPNGDTPGATPDGLA